VDFVERHRQNLALVASPESRLIQQQTHAKDDSGVRILTTITPAERDAAFARLRAAASGGDGQCRAELELLIHHHEKLDDAAFEELLVLNLSIRGEKWLPDPIELAAIQREEREREFEQRRRANIAADLRARLSASNGGPPDWHIGLQMRDVLTRCGICPADEFLSAFSPDGRWLAYFPVVASTTPEENPGKLVELQSRQATVLPVDGVTRGMAWSPCSRWIATYQEPHLDCGDIRVQAVPTGRVAARLDGLQDPDENDPLADSPWFTYGPHDRSDTLRWSPDGTHLLVRDRKNFTDLRLDMPAGTLPFTQYCDAPADEPGLTLWAAKAGARTGVGLPARQIHSADRRYATLVWPGGGTLVWDLKKPALVFRGKTPAGATIHDPGDGLLLGGGPPPWALCVSTGRLVNFQQEMGIREDRVAYPRHGGREVLLVGGSALTLIDAIDQTVRWTRPIGNTGAVRLLWLDSGRSYFFTCPAERRAFLHATDSGAQIASWPWRFTAQRTMELDLSVTAEGVIAVPTRWGVLEYRRNHPEPVERR
jgi:hypothetical protein